MPKAMGYSAEHAGPRVPGKAPRYRRKSAAVRREELIDAAISCLAAGGLTAFTIDNICREARVSRGLINHHFSGKDDLLAQVYARMTAYLAEGARACLEQDAPPVARLNAMIEGSFGAGAFDRTHLRAWLALWSEVAVDSNLQALHRQRYDAYRRILAQVIAEVARERGRTVEADTLALMLIALIDGLWLEWCLDESVLTLPEARAVCHRLLEQHVGRLEE